MIKFSPQLWNSATLTPSRSSTKWKLALPGGAKEAPLDVLRCGVLDGASTTLAVHRVHLPFTAHLAQAVARMFPSKPEHGECVCAMENITTRRTLPSSFTAAGPVSNSCYGRMPCSLILMESYSEFPDGLCQDRNKDWKSVSRISKEAPRCCYITDRDSISSELL